MTSRLELAPWIITMGRPAASRGPISTMLRLAPATSIILPCTGYVRCRISTPIWVISARIASAATATTDIIENVRMGLGTNELRFGGIRVSRLRGTSITETDASEPGQFDGRPPQIDAEYGAENVDLDAFDPTDGQAQIAPEREAHTRS